jgi:hypothetical protein
MVTCLATVLSPAVPASGSLRCHVPARLLLLPPIRRPRRTSGNSLQVSFPLGRFRSSTGLTGCAGRGRSPASTYRVPIRSSGRPTRRLIWSTSSPAARCRSGRCARRKRPPRRSCSSCASRRRGKVPLRLGGLNPLAPLRNPPRAHVGEGRLLWWRASATVSPRRSGLHSARPVTLRQGGRRAGGAGEPYEGVRFAMIQAFNGKGASVDDPQMAPAPYHPSRDESG